MSSKTRLLSIFPQNLAATGKTTTDNVTEGSTNLYYTSARANADFDTRLGTKSTSNLTEGTNLYYTSTRANTDFDTRLATKSTTNLAEGTNLYYTDSRVASYLTSNNYATQSYVGTQLANLVDSSPATLDTLNELAAALGDDPNFATTVSTSIGTKVSKVGDTMTGQLTIDRSTGGTEPYIGLVIKNSGSSAGIKLEGSSRTHEIQSGSDGTFLVYDRTANAYRFTIGSDGTLYQGNSSNAILHTGNYTSYVASVNGNNSNLTIGSSDWAKNNGEANVIGQVYGGAAGDGRFMFHSGVGVMNIYTDGNYYANEGNNLVLHTANYSSYALPLSGGELVTTSDQGLTISKASGWNYMAFTVAGTRKSYFGVSSGGTPIWGSDTGTMEISGSLTVSGNLSSTGTISSTNNRLVLRDDSIENHATDNDSAGIAINYFGYQSGNSRFRDLNVYNGKSSLKFAVYGSTGRVYVNDYIQFQQNTGTKLRFYDSSIDKYGIDVQNSELRIYSGAQGDATGGITFGKYDGTTFTERVRVQNNGVLKLTNTYLDSPGVGYGARFGNLHVGYGTLYNTIYSTTNLHLRANTNPDTSNTGNNGNIFIGDSNGGNVILGTELYVSHSNRNTLNSGFSYAGHGADIWLNYRGYNDGHSYYRNFNVGDGRGNAYIFGEGDTGRVGIGTAQSTLARLHVREATPSGTGSKPAGTTMIVDSNTHNYILFRNSADNGTYSGIAMQDNNVGGYCVFGNAGGGGDKMYIAGYGGVVLQTGTSDSINPAARTTVLSVDGSGTTVFSHLVPSANASYDLGSSSLAWRNVYTNDLHLSNEGHESGNSVDGTKGNWTIQEGEDHLFIINNKNGKKYRFALEEIV